MKVKKRKDWLIRSEGSKLLLKQEQRSQTIPWSGYMIITKEVRRKYMAWVKSP